MVIFDDNYNDSLNLIEKFDGHIRWPSVYLYFQFAGYTTLIVFHCLFSYLSCSKWWYRPARPAKFKLNYISNALDALLCLCLYCLLFHFTFSKQVIPLVHSAMIPPGPPGEVWIKLTKQVSMNCLPCSFTFYFVISFLNFQCESYRPVRPAKYAPWYTKCSVEASAQLSLCLFHVCYHVSWS